VFTEGTIIQAARERIGSKVSVSVGEEWVPDAAIRGEIRENVLECGKLYGTSTSQIEKDFFATIAPRLTAPAATATANPGGGIIPGMPLSYGVSALSGSDETRVGIFATLDTTSVGACSVTLTWPASFAATGYNIYGRVGPHLQLLATVGPNTLTWTDVGTAIGASGVPIEDSTGRWIQDYPVDLYISPDVLRITEVLRSDSYRSESFLEPSYDVDPLTGVRSRRGGFVDQSLQEPAFEVMQAQVRWVEAQKYSWMLVNKAGVRCLRLLPRPEQPCLMRITYQSYASNIASLPEEARVAMELACCRAILDGYLNRIKSEPTGLGETALERRAYIDMLVKQRDYYRNRYKSVLPGSHR